MTDACDQTCVEKGYCDKHDVEVERRRNSDKEIKRIPWIMTTLNRVIGYSVLATVFILGSYSFTLVSSMASDKQHDHAKEQIEELTEKVSDLTTIIATTTVKGDERHKSLIKQLEDTNSLLRALLIEQKNNRNGAYSQPYYNGNGDF